MTCGDAMSLLVARGSLRSCALPWGNPPPREAASGDQGEVGVFKLHFNQTHSNSQTRPPRLDFCCHSHSEDSSRLGRRCGRPGKRPKKRKPEAGPLEAGGKGLDCRQQHPSSERSSGGSNAGLLELEKQSSAWPRLA